MRNPVLLLLPALVLAGCVPQARNQSDTLIYSRGEDANTLDPVHTDIGETVKVLVNLYDTLVTYDDRTTDLVPALAESWKMSDDGLQWTFHLRSGVEFHDGTPFNAEAVAFSFERLIAEKHPHVHEPGRPYQSSFQVIERIEVVDDRTVAFHLKTPSAVFFQNLAMFPAGIVSPTAVKKQGKSYGEHPAGTGPFKLVKWDRDRQLVLGANEKYWNGAPGVKNVLFLPVRESATRVQQIKRGEVHIADDLPPLETDELAKHPELRVQEEVGLNVGYLTMQTEKPPFDNAEVRRAIAMAIDKREYARVVFADHAVTAKTMVPPAMWGHHAKLPDTAFDPQAAKELLENVAKKSGIALPLRTSLSVMAQPRPYLQQPKVAAEFIKDALAKIGIEVTVENRDVNQHFPHLMAGKYELGLAGWSSDNNDPDNFLYSLLDEDNIGEFGNNLSRFRNARLHELLKNAQTELDRQKREAMYLEAQEIVAREMPVVPLVHTRIRIVERKNVRGYVLHPTSLVRLRLARLEVAP